MSGKQKKKWYQDVQTLLTFVGIVLSLTLSIFNIIKANKKDKAESISEALDSIDQSITELISLDQKSADYFESSVQSNLYLRRKIIVASLSQKVLTIEEEISAQVFLFIGQEYVKENDFSKAENYFQKALDKTEKTDFRTRALVFGSLAYLQGVKKDEEKKDLYWKQQILEVKKIAIPERFLTLSSTYEAAALSEFDFGNNKVAATFIDSAIFYLKKTDLIEADRIIQNLKRRLITESINDGNYYLPITRQSLSAFLSSEFEVLFENGLQPGPSNQSTVQLLRDFGIDSLQKFVGQIPPGLSDAVLSYDLSGYNGHSLIEWVLIIRDTDEFLNHYPNDSLSSFEVELLDRFNSPN